MRSTPGSMRRRPRAAPAAHSTWCLHPRKPVSKTRHCTLPCNGLNNPVAPITCGAGASCFRILLARKGSRSVCVPASSGTMPEWGSRTGAVMRKVHAIAWLLLAALAGVAAAAPRDIGTRIDAVYLDLGRGDKAEAFAHSAALLDEVPLRDRRRGDVLSLRVDVLAQTVELNKPAGAALHDAITA